MRTFLTAVTAATIGLGGIAATAAEAQTTRTVVVEHHDRHYSGYRHHTRRVCDTVWRHHHKVKRCRTVRR